MIDLVEEVTRKAADLPAGKAHVIVMARGCARRAAAIVRDAVAADPTLPDEDRCRRDIDVIAEILRQMKPLIRQTEVLLRRRQLVAEDADPTQIARLGRTNPVAPDELEAMSLRVVEIAQRVKASAVAEWTPEMVRERSEGLLPSARRLEEIADQLRYAIKDSLALPYPAEEAVRLAALADQIAPAPHDVRGS